MKKILSMIALTVLMVALAGSCTKNFEERLDKTDADVATLKAAIGQYGELQSDITTVLQALRAEVGNRPASEQQSVWNCINALQSQSNAFDAALKALQKLVGETSVDEQISGAVENLVNTYSLDELASTLKSLEEEVARKFDVQSLEKQINQLSKTVREIDYYLARINAFYGLVQSVAILPKYDDGSIKAGGDGLVEFECVVTPASALVGISDADLTKCFTLTLAAVGTEAPESAEIAVTSAAVADPENGIVKITADIFEYIPEDNSRLMLALNLKLGASDYTTEFVPVTVASAKPIVEYVVIGGLKWATKNLGAEKVTDSGDYFAWGEIAPYYTTTGGWPANPTWESEKETGYTWQSYCGHPDFVEWSTPPYDATSKILKPEFDAATQTLGDGWRMPTSAEFKALYDACGGSYDKTTNPGKDTSVGKGVYWCTSYDGVVGCLFCDGTNKLFFPAAGCGDGTSLIFAGSYGLYWSSSFSTDYTKCAYHLYFDSGTVNKQSNTSRCFGFSVRPVKD